MEGFREELFREEYKKLLEFLKEEFPHGEQTFFSRNTAGDEMINIYKEDVIHIDYCPHWDYIEIFGLTKDEEKELERNTNYCSFPSCEFLDDDDDEEEEKTYDDCISRAEAIEAVLQYANGDLMAEVIKRLPSVTPKTGEKEVN